MQFLEFDPFEFSHWESQEHLAVCRQAASVRGTNIDSLDDFLENTKQKQPFDKATWPIAVSQLQPSFAGKNTDLQMIASYFKKLMRIDVSPHQEFFILFQEPLLLDVAWRDDRHYFNRALWQSLA